MHAVGGIVLAASRHMQRKASEDSARAERNAIRQALGDASPPLSNILDASSLGIAIYDDNSRCVVMNKALASMNGTSPKAHVGKTIRQSLGEDASQVEPSFRQAWITGKSLHDVELTIRLPRRQVKTHFVLHLFPFRDNPGDMRLIGVLFYEITNKKKLQERLRNLIEMAGKSASDGEGLLSGESSELTAHSIEMLQHSIEMLDCWMALRCQISEMRIIAALRCAAPFSDVPRRHELFLGLDALSLRPDADPSIRPESEGQGGQPADSPSHREQQVMQLLVEGNSNKEVAAVLSLSTRTVEIYRARLMMKLHLHSVAELVRYAVRNNLIKA
jgi:DNA-binding CsgD family transcriptional regulator